MARDSEKEERSSEHPTDPKSATDSAIDNIQQLAYNRARTPLNNEESLILYLRSWWSRTYNRPLKDPLLLEYTLEELLYEFYDRIERTAVEKERVEQLNDKIEEDTIKDTLDWAEQEEQKELAAAAIKLKDGQSVPPKVSEEDKKWMEEVANKELEKAKEVFGETFGQDIDEEF